MKELIQNAYKGKNVLITGHTGFKGSWLSIWLNELGANVIGYALDPFTEKDNYVLSGIEEKIIDIRGDIRNKKKLSQVFKNYRPDIVFHLAAQPIVKHSFEKPVYTYDVNFMGTVNVLENIRLSQETKVGIIITSDKCYENMEWPWAYRENDRLGGYDPYSSSKACIELLVSSYVNSFFNTDKFSEHQKVIASTRAGNVIGGGDWSKYRIVPDCIRALESGNEIILRNPGSTRPWQHVLEPLSGYLILGAKILQEGSKFSGPWNFGPSPESIVTVEEISNKIIQYWGKGSWKCSPDNSFHESGLLHLDYNKSKYLLKWEPRWNIDETLKKTIEWYKNYTHENIYDLCSQQINDYMGI